MTRGELNMNGSLQKKKDLFYAVINITDSEGNRKQKWIPTGIRVKGGKREAERRLNEIIREYETCNIDYRSEFVDALFVDFMAKWLELIVNQVEPNTLESYKFAGTPLN
jgi:hypothetical protein